MAAATVGILRVLLTANTAEWEAGMKKASDSAKVWSRDLNQIGEQAQRVGSALTKTITIPIVAAFAGAAKAAIDFESSFANVAKTVDGVSDKSGNLTKEGKALAQTFRNMAKEIPATTSELNSIAALGGQMGVPIKQLEKFTKHVAALGVAVDGISTEEAAAGLAQIGNITGQGTKHIDKMASALVHLGNSSNATEADILEFTKRLSGAGHAVGMTVPEIMAVGTAMANVGLNAEAGGTAMSTMIAKMSKAVSQGGDALKEFDRIVAHTGQSFSDIWKRSPVEAIDAVVQGLGHAKARGEDLNVVVAQIGATNIRTADTMKRLAGAGDGVSQMLAVSNEGWQTGNKHLEEAEKKYQTTEKQLKMLWSQIRDVGITLGNSMLPAIKSTTHAISSLIPFVDAVANGFAALPGPIQMSVVGVGLMLAATGPLIYAFGTLARTGGDLVGAFQKKGIATRGLTSAFNGLAGPASTAASWVTRIGTAAKASGLLFAGLSAAVAGIVVPAALIVISNHLDKLRKDLDAIQKASDLAGRGVTDPDEARALIAAHQAGLEGRPPEGLPKVTPEGITPGVRRVQVDPGPIEQALPDWLKGLLGLAPVTETRRFQPITVEEVQIWEKAKGAVESYDGQVRQVRLTQADANQELRRTGSLTVEQLQAIAQLSGATKTYAGGVIEIGQANKGAAGSANLLAAAQKELAAANAAYLKDIEGKRDVLKFAIENMDALGLTTEEIGKKYNVSKEHVERFKNELKDGAKAAKEHEKELTAAEKAAEKHAQAIAKQREALEKLGIVTENQVLKELAELNELIEHATDAGVPFDQVMLAIGPHLKDLADKAKASGVSMDVFGNALSRAAEAAGKARQSIAQLPQVVAGLSGLALPVAGLNQQMNLAQILAQNTAESFKFFGVHTQASLHATAQAAIAHFKTVRDSGLAAPQAIQQAYDEMVAALRAAGIDVEAALKKAGVEIRREWTSTLGEIATAADALARAFDNAFGQILQAAANTLRSLENLFTAKSLWGKISAAIDLGVGLFQAASRLFRDEEHEQVNDMRDEFLAQFGPGGTGPGSGFHTLAAQLHELGPQGDALFQRLLNAKKVEEFERAMEAVNEALAHTPEALARAAGFQTRDELQATADKAREVYEFMRDSGKYTAEQIAEAFQKMRDAQIEAMDDEQRAMVDHAQTRVDVIKKQLDELNAEYDRLFEAVSAEAPEEVMGVVEQAQRARMAAIEEERKALQTQLEEANKTLEMSMNRVAEAMENLAKTMREKVGGAIDDLDGRKIRIDVEFNPGDVPTPSGASSSHASTGGMVRPWGVQPKYMGLGGPINWQPRGIDTVPIMGAVGEGIVNRPGMSILGEDGLAALNSGKLPDFGFDPDAMRAAMRAAMGGVQAIATTHRLPMGAIQGAGPIGPIQAVSILQVDKRELGRAVADVLPGELRRLGVRVRS